ncbi:CHAT domain-containing protein [Desulfococcus sp.]|uniref:CHAT domain-containing protein n=1 Tax=Desulfococcus sp. TaxID=2025834 RepID=UPI0035940B12
MPAPASVDEVINAYYRQGLGAYNEGLYPQAEKAWQKGLASAREGGRTAREAEFLVRLSQANEGMGRYDAALAHAVGALRILEEGGDREMLCMALMQKGLACRRTARYAAARPYFDRALMISRKLNNPHLESESLRNIAALLQDQGQLDAALPLFNEAISLARAHGDERSEARSLNNLGLLFDAQAEYPEALSHQQASLALRRKTGDRAGEGKVLGNICITYNRLNQIAPALAHCEAALTIAEEIGDRQRAANHLNNIGALYRGLNQPRKALRYYRRSLRIKRQLNDPAGEARALNNIGETYWRMGNLGAAEDYLERSIEIKAAIGDLPGQSASWQNLALLHRQRGGYPQAKSAYMKALFFNSRAARPELIWRAYDGLSYVYEDLSMPDVAILYGKQALKSIQNTRGGMAAIEKPLRLSYLSDKARVYRHVADLLIRQGRLLEAQQVLSLLKEEEYLDFLDTRGPEEASVDDVVITVTEQPPIERLAAFDGELGELGYEMDQLETRRREQGLTHEEQRRLDQLYERADEIQEAFEAYLQHLEASYENKIAFGEKDLESLQAIQGELGEFKKRTAIATFLVSGDSVSVILTAPSIQIPYRIPIPETDLNRLVFYFRQTLVRPDRDPRPQARALYDLLVSPIEQDLARLQVETLMVSLDGALRYLPFAALFDGKRYLAERWNLALFTPAAKTLFGEKKIRDPRIAGLGTSEEIAGFSKLPAVADELDGIVKEDDETDLRGVLPGKVLLNQAFTAAGLAEMLGQGYPLIHLATHFSFRPGTAEDSFLLLGDGGRLSLAELESRRYPFKFIDLLTLSACETAVGGEDARGREIESFAALAQKRGAGAILATLWPVADVSTGTFMQLFYQLRNEHGLSKAESLRQVQQKFLEGRHDMEAHEREHRGVVVADDDEGAFTPSPHAPYAHPFYWAPFILMGNFL